MHEYITKMFFYKNIVHPETFYHFTCVWGENWKGCNLSFMLQISKHDCTTCFKTIMYCCNRFRCTRVYSMCGF